MNYNTSNMSNAVAYAPADVRAGFIRKVYNLLFSSVLVTVLVGAFCAQPSIAETIFGMRMLFLIAGFVCVMVMSVSRKTNGLNLFLMYLFAAIQGAVLGPLMLLLNMREPGIPAQAAWLTIAVFGGLSMYVLQSKKDFSYMGGMLFAGLIALIVAGIVMMFFQTSLMAAVYCVFGVLLFCGFVLYDTSMIMNRLGPDEAVAGAISLYLDLLNLFLLILRLLSGRRN